MSVCVCAHRLNKKVLQGHIKCNSDCFCISKQCDFPGSEVTQGSPGKGNTKTRTFLLKKKHIDSLIGALFSFVCFLFL